MTTPHSITDRLQLLEDREAIRELKSRYLAACDAKDPVGMRACFVDGPVHIDFGAIGTFESADALVEVFKAIGCHPHMVEMHHGVNPRIDHVSPGHAKGHWALHYQLINTRDKTLTQLGAYYDDEYLRESDGTWRIQKTRCVITSMLVLQLAEDAIKRLFAGNAPSAAA